MQHSPAKAVLLFPVTTYSDDYDAFTGEGSELVVERAEVACLYDLNPSADLRKKHGLDENVTGLVWVPALELRDKLLSKLEELYERRQRVEVQLYAERFDVVLVRAYEPFGPGMLDAIGWELQLRRIEGSGLGEDVAYVPVSPTACEPVIVTDRFGEAHSVLSGGTYTEAPLTPAVVTDRFAVQHLLGEGETYTEAPVAPATVNNPNEGTSIEMGEGEVYEVPLVTVQDVYSLEFNYPVDHDNTITATITAGYAATYTGHTLQNVATVTYKKNGAVATLPVPLAAGDTLEQTITRTNAAAAAKVTMNS